MKFKAIKFIYLINDLSNILLKKERGKEKEINIRLSIYLIIISIFLIFSIVINIYLYFK